jgi:hypothetical protein
LCHRLIKLELTKGVGTIVAVTKASVFTANLPNTIDVDYDIVDERIEMASVELEGVEITRIKVIYAQHRID